MAPDGDRIDRLVADFAARSAGDLLEMSRFLFGAAPAALVDAVFAGETETSGPLWIMHLSGYFGGVWLRGAIRRAQPDNALLAVGQPPTRAGFDNLLEAPGRALVAIAGDDSAALAFAADSLPALAAGFGYNEGYLQQILEVPPDGTETSGDVITSLGPLLCHYASECLSCTAKFSAHARRAVESGDPEWASRLDRLRPVLKGSHDQGRAVWSSGLSMDGLTAADYAVLLGLSSRFLEVIQATALSALRAAAERDADLARISARANAHLGVWQASYGLGLMDPTPDRRDERLPSFTGSYTSRR